MCLVALGVGAVIAPLPFRGSALRYALLGLPLAAIGIYIAWDGKVSRVAGALLILFYVAYVAAIWLIEKQPPALGEVGELDEAGKGAGRRSGTSLWFLEVWSRWLSVRQLLLKSLAV